MANAAAHWVLLIGALIAFEILGVFTCHTYTTESGPPEPRAGAVAVVAVLGLGGLLAVIDILSS